MICTRCGAPLRRPPDSPIATCDHCGAQVTIPEAAPNPPVSLHDHLQDVERWWEHARRPYMRQDRHGVLHPPEELKVTYVVFMILGGVLGLVSTGALAQTDWKWLGFATFFLFPVMISLPAGMLLQRNERRYKEYKELEKEYEGRRNAVVDLHARRA